jgi:predicted adenine nucleotide alpha hydrolase (AANH) superfamily ATPase
MGIKLKYIPIVLISQTTRVRSRYEEEFIIKKSEIDFYVTRVRRMEIEGERGSACKAHVATDYRMSDEVAVNLSL